MILNASSTEILPKQLPIFNSEAHGCVDELLSVCVIVCVCLYALILGLLFHGQSIDKLHKYVLSSKTLHFIRTGTCMRCAAIAGWAPPSRMPFDYRPLG